MGKNILSQTSDLRIFFNRKYDRKSNTIDEASAEYIMDKVRFLIRELKDANGGRFYKVIAKHHLQSIGLKTETAFKINQK